MRGIIPGIVSVRHLSSDLRKKAESLLRVYGGLDGFSKNPPWLINTVLRTWFTEEERSEIMRFLFQGMKKYDRLPMLKALGVR